MRRIRAFFTQKLGNEDYIIYKFITCHKTDFKHAPSGYKWRKLAHPTPQSIFIHADLWTIPAESYVFWSTYTFGMFQRQDHCAERQSISQSATQKVSKIVWSSCLLTGDLVNKNTRSNDASILWKKLLQLLLGHCFRKSADIQIRISDRSRTWASIGNLGKENGIKHLHTLSYLPLKIQRLSKVSSFSIQSM